MIDMDAKPWLLLMRVTDGRRRWWALADAVETLTGQPSETRSAILARWRKRKPIVGPLTRIVGVMRMSEAALEVCSRRREL